MTNDMQDEYAFKIFDTSYHTLSPWGKAHVDDVIRKFSRMETNYNPPIVEETTTLRIDNERLSKLVQVMEEENRELWERNTELEAELAELQRQWNPPSS
jgi:hypothetical protein